MQRPTWSCGEIVLGGNDLTYVYTGGVYSDW